MKIFISYARVDQDKVLPLYQRLKDEGFDPWIDREHLLPGVRWRAAIEQAMRDSDFFLLCLSAQSSNRRGFIQREINTALDLWEERLQDDIYFIPLRLEECEIPARVDEFQCVNWFEADGWHRLLKALHYQAEKLRESRKSTASLPTPEPKPELPPTAPPPRTEPIVIKPEPKPEPARVAPPRPKPENITPIPQPIRVQEQRSAMKWGGAGLAVIILAVATYWATKTNNKVSPSSFDSPSNTQPLLSQQSPSPGDEFTENLKGVKLVMKSLPGGEFLMGSPDNESGRYGDEGPQHRVKVSAFSIGKTEVTQAQWKAVMGGANPSNSKGDELPVESISWNDAKEFCQRLSSMTGKIYRLPSEAEWEYACRAGTTGAYAGDLDAMAWYSNNADSKTHPVGQKQANRFGLFDMHGNVWEWCEDVWHDSYGGQHGNPPSDGSAWLSGGDSSFRALWGGIRYVRSASRDRDAPGDRGIDSGVRVVLSSRTR
ncbi:MAG: SUMF1/EgtB/PvdO family nonheme iron enzyme [Blastocatellia bacterium]